MINDPRESTPIVQEISTLYEVSLSIGNSLDLEENCSSFISALLSRQAFISASVWIDSKYLGGDKLSISKSSLIKVYSAPLPLSEIDTLPYTHPLVQELGDADFFAYSNEEASRKSLFLDRTLDKGSLLVFKLDRIGILKLRYAFNDISLLLPKKLLSVVKKFSVSLEASISHAKLVSEVRERKLAQAALSRSETLYKTHVANFNAAVLVENKTRNIVLANEMFCELFSIPLKPEQIVGLDCTDAAENSKHLFLYPEQFVHNVKAIVEKKEQVINQIVDFADGRVVERDFIPIIIDGEYEGHLWIYRDVTLRLKVEKALRLQNSILNGVAKAAERILKDKDLDKAIQFSLSVIGKGANVDRVYIYENVTGSNSENKLMRRRYEWNNSDLKLANDSTIPEEYDYFPTFSRWYTELSQGNTIGGVAKFFPKPEAEILNHRGVKSIMIAPIFIDKEFWGFIGFDVCNDERQWFGSEDSILKAVSNILGTAIRNNRFEKELNELKNFYEQVLNTMPAQLAVFDVNNRYRFVTPSAVANKETRQWIIGKTNEEYCQYRGLDLAIGTKRTALQLEATRAKKNVSFEEEITTKDGRTLHYYRQITPVINEHGEVTDLLGFGLDITALKEAEKDLKNAIQVAEQSKRAKEMFLANMSHEIRTPMNAIVGLSNLLLETPLSNEQRHFLKTIKQSSDNLLVIINDILDLSKIEAGKMEILSQPFQLHSLIDNITNLLKPKAIEKNLGFNCNIDQNIPEYLIGDSTRIYQILTNLLSNAIKFTEKGKVTLEAVLLQSKNERASIQFKIRDSGIGIDEQHLDSIFESFSQGNLDTAKRFGGTGLGLSIVKNLVELHEGKIEVESKIGEGSVFTVTLNLPITKGLSSPFSNHDFPNGSLEGLKILLVEDNYINQVVASHTLKKWKINPDIASNGEEAIIRVEAGEYDLILMDVQMPGMDGYATTRSIRQLKNPRKANVPILAMTAGVLTEEREKCFAVGMNEYISKPFNPDDLFYKISSLTGIESHKRDAPKKTTSSIEEGENHEKLNLENLETFAGGDVEFINEMIDLFLTQMPAQVDALIKSYEEKNYQMLKSIAHKIKPNFHLMGFPEQKNVLSEIEEICENENFIDSQKLDQNLIKFKNRLSACYLLLNNRLHSK
ncbi:MAG: ATP-binding protein [Chloroherpetonaceae bacterium]|nr:ATP-binding protein [Chloroherpetonaceae bacterium]